MHLAVERGVPFEERSTVTADLPGWDAARSVLDVVVRCSGFRFAAERLRTSVNAARRRIDKLVRLGRMHMQIFASQKYLETTHRETTHRETHGARRNLDETHRHRLVMRVADEAAAREVFENVFPDHAQRDLVLMKTKVSSADQSAIANGAGIDVLLTYALRHGRKIIPFDIGQRSSFDVWLSNCATSWLIRASTPRNIRGLRLIHPSTGN